MKEVCQQALDKWGLEKQELILIEEMAELTQALIKNRRNDTNAVHANLVEEIADVEIMLMQLKMGRKIERDVQSWKEYKIKALKQKVLG